MSGAKCGEMCKQRAPDLVKVELLRQALDTVSHVQAMGASPDNRCTSLQCVNRLLIPLTRLLLMCGDNGDVMLQKH